MFQWSFFDVIFQMDTPSYKISSPLIQNTSCLDAKNPPKVKQIF